jgi:hypothetical protein
VLATADPDRWRTPDVAVVVKDYSNWLKQSNIPKLFVNAEPGVLFTGGAREFCRFWPNQTEVTVEGYISSRRIALQRSVRHSHTSAPL